MIDMSSFRLSGLRLVAALFLAFAIPGCSTSSDGETAGPIEVGEVELDGNVLTPFAEPDTALGVAAPSFSAQTVDGDAVEYDNGDGTARLYLFFTHWCSHCQAELPEVVTWLSENPVPDGVEVVAISTRVDEAADNYPPSEWFDAEGWEGLVVVDDADSTLADSYGLTTFPYSVAVDAGGEVVARTGGRISEVEFLDLLDLLANG